MAIKRLNASGFLAAALILLADQAVKSWAHAWVSTNGPARIFTGLNIIATSNTGLAFSIGEGAGLGVLVGIAVVISVGLTWWMMHARTRAEAIGLGLAIGGAVSNVLDRLRLGSVRDLIDLYWREWHWPTFNLADAAIVTGLALVVLWPKQPGREKSFDDVHAAMEREGK